MSSKQLRIMALFFIIMVFFSGCAEDVFDGNLETCKDSFRLHFDKLNRTITHQMILEKDDILSVSIHIEKGELDLSVANGQGDFIYKGDNAFSGEFSVKISQKGEYHFEVTGRNAAGKVSFILRREEPDAN